MIGTREPDDTRFDLTEQDAKEHDLYLWDALHGPDPADLREDQ